MSRVEVERWRQAVRRGDVPGDLVEVLRRAARSLVFRPGLPPSFAPYGAWNDEAADEVFSAWYADRMLPTSRLLTLLDRADSAGATSALAERSMRQHLINAADRSQAANLYRRVVRLLREDQAFRLIFDSAHQAQAWYALAARSSEDASRWEGTDKDLLARLWSVGDLVVIRYRAQASKLSPVLDAEELKRVLIGLFEATDARALTPDLIMRALSARLDLGTLLPQALDSVAPGRMASAPVENAVVMAETVDALAMNLSQRQREVLRRLDEPVAQVARALRCSVGTVVNERRRAGAQITRFSGDDLEREQVLNLLLDHLYAHVDD